ncbi:unnamed protein product [Microthlaspi erraticum]|uniref:GATA-type domain-containing protein n=1 Tax=Microthlaspi erraticum TaxID=1685480 RepID=A0A6D2IHY5_9BRAS|nr:unnamed protein product [Microthlaspi erraticum]
MEEKKETIRSCSVCKTTKTPMWRGGPAGPKSLCNACGIRLRKQRRSELLGIRIIHSHKAFKKINPSPPSTSSSSSISTSSVASSHVCVALKKRRRNLKEEEQAALCLLLLSCSSVFA